MKYKYSNAEAATYEGCIVQANITETMDGDIYAWISRSSEDGYCGVLVDSIAVDAVQRTNWKAAVGTYDEVVDAIHQMEESLFQ